MHSALQIAPVLAAEKSKTAFYIAGGLLVAWALIISMAVGMRRPRFPSSLTEQRAVMGVTVLLVLFTIAMAVVTSGPPGKTEEAGAAAALSTKNGETTSTAATTPTATTGAPAPAAAGSRLSIAADPSGQLAYTTTKLQTKAGKVTMTMTNTSPLEHNLTIAQGTKVLGATPTFVGGSRTLTLNLKPGVYTFFCSVPGLRQAGMEGTLTVGS